MTQSPSYTPINTPGKIYQDSSNPPKVIDFEKAVEQHTKTSGADNKTISDYIHRITNHLSSCDCKGGKLCISSFGQDPRSGKDIVPKFEFFEPSNPRAIIRYISTLNQDKHRNVCMALALYGDKAEGRGKTLDIISVFGVAADFDDKNASGYLARLPTPPGMAFESSRAKYHAHYYFEELLSVNKAQEIGKAIAAHSGCDKASADVNKAWRIPGTQNYPNKTKCMNHGRSPEPQLSKIVQEFSGYTDPQKLMEKLKAHIQPQKEKKALIPLPVIECTPIDENLFIWDSVDIESLPLSRSTKDLILEGRQKGQRSEALMAVLNGLAYSNCTDEQIFKIMDEYPIGEKYTEHGDRRQSWLKPQIDKARSQTTKRATKSLKPKATRTTAVKHNQTFQNDAAQELADVIYSRLIDKLEVKAADTATLKSLEVDVSVIEQHLSRSFWSGSRSKMFMLNNSESLNQYIGVEAYNFLEKEFGQPVKTKAIGSAAAALSGNSKGKFKALVKECLNIPSREIVDYLKLKRQREQLEYRVDMFADAGRMELLPDKVRVIHTHKPFVGGDFDPKIVDDFRLHFSRLDEFIDFIVYSRFMKDRKKCYLWIHADSDFGKNFLLGVLKELPLCVELSMKEIEGIFEGKPSGRSPSDFKNAFVLAVDEFKSVKAEMKQLGSEISLSPKFQFTSSVEVYAKVFLSAENVSSLVSENGVEDQFCNRMSVFREHGSLPNRPMYIEIGNSLYFESIKNYFAQRINLAVAELQSLGKTGSERASEIWIDEFIKRNGIDTLYDRLSERLPGVADEFISYCMSRGLIASDGGYRYLSNFNRAFQDYLYEKYAHGEIQTIWHKKTQVAALCSEDGKGIKACWIGGKSVKAIRLK